MSFLRKARPFVLSFSLLGCSGGGDDGLGGGACNALGAKVFNGDACDQNARTAVVAVFPVGDDGSQLVPLGICSGTLVTVDDILTSAHCLVGPVQQYGAGVVAFAAKVGGDNGEVLFIKNGAIHPLYDGSVGTPYDLAMLTLERVPNPPIGPVPILLSQLTLPGQEMSVFGYGTNNRGEIGILESAEIRIDSLHNGNLIATIVSSGASICQGDSGGPVVQVVNGITSIIGVNSFGTATTAAECAAHGAQLSGFVDLQYSDILDFIFDYAPDVPVA